MIQTISIPLCDPMPYDNPSLKVQLNATISKDGIQCISRYRNEKGDFISVNINPRIVFRYIDKNIPWSPTQQIVVNQRSLFHLKLGFKEFYNNFQRDGLFKYNQDGNISELLADKSDVARIPISGQMMILEPGVVSDRHGKIFPGVYMTLNSSNNLIELSIVEFESLYEVILGINLVDTGLTLLQTYIGLSKIPVQDKIEEDERKREEKPKSNIQGSIFGNRPENILPEKEIVSGGIIKQPTSLDELQ